MKNFLIIGLLIIAVSMSGCTTSSVNGTYVHEDKPDERLVLESGREYTVHKPSETFGGSYRIIDGDLYLLIPLGSLKLQKSGNV